MENRKRNIQMKFYVIRRTSDRICKEHGLCSFAAVKVVIDKGGIVAVNGTRRVEQHRF